METLPEHLGGHLGKTNLDTTIITSIQDVFNIKTMIDIGCGPGGMKQVAEALDIEWLGIDGDYTLPNKDEITIHDFTEGPLNLEGDFDLAWSTEFLEHVEEKYVANYMPVFAKARLAIVTAATPGTEGTHHVNCKDLMYWTKVFGQYGFKYLENETAQLKSISNMRKDFFKRHGMVFIKEQ
jgi:hypothetical protein